MYWFVQSVVTHHQRMSSNDMSSLVLDTEKLKGTVQDNSLYLLTYHDNAHAFPERYQVRRSLKKIRVVTNHEWSIMYQYHIYLWIAESKNKGYFENIGKVHPRDLMSLIDSNGISIIIDNFEVSANK